MPGLRAFRLPDEGRGETAAQRRFAVGGESELPDSQEEGGAERTEYEVAWIDRGEGIVGVGR